MPSFEVRYSSFGFPAEVSGVMIPDTGGSGLNFGRHAYSYRSTDEDFIALYLAELGGEEAITSLNEYRDRLRAIVTFGMQSVDYQTLLGTTHFGAVARELNIPLLGLAEPPGYPKLQDDWIKNNPLKSMFSTEVILKYTGDQATFEPANS